MDMPVLTNNLIICLSFSRTRDSFHYILKISSFKKEKYITEKWYRSENLIIKVPEICFFAAILHQSIIRLDVANKKIHPVDVSSFANAFSI